MSIKKPDVPINSLAQKRTLQTCRSPHLLSSRQLFICSYRYLPRLSLIMDDETVLIVKLAFAEGAFPAIAGILFCSSIAQVQSFMFASPTGNFSMM